MLKNKRDLSFIIKYLNQQRGVDFFGYRTSFIQKRLDMRIEATGVSDSLGYLLYLERYPEELDRLLDVFTINVSSFFRDRIAFASLEEKILANLFYDKKISGESSIRIWSAGCSSGEEPYSVAMLARNLQKKQYPEISVEIFATDIDEEVLLKAVEGRYSFDSVKHVPFYMMQDYFQKRGDIFEVSQEIRDIVHFSRHDITSQKDHFPVESVYGDFDLILCRNVLIYFSSEVRGKIWDNFNNILHSNGSIMLGIAGFLENKYKDTFIEVNAFSKIYTKI